MSRGSHLDEWASLLGEDVSDDAVDRRRSEESAFDDSDAHAG